MQRCARPWRADLAHCRHRCSRCRSLFEKDKLLFAFLLCARIMLGQKELDPGHYQFLLTGAC